MSPAPARAAVPRPGLPAAAAAAAARRAREVEEGSVGLRRGHDVVHRAGPPQHPQRVALLVRGRGRRHRPGRAGGGGRVVLGPLVLHPAHGHHLRAADHRVRRVLVVRRGLVRGPAVRPVEGGGEADEAVVEDLCHGDDGEAHAEPQQPARVGQEADAGDLLIFYELFHVGILRHDRDCIKTVRARARRPPL